MTLPPFLRLSQEVIDEIIDCLCTGCALYALPVALVSRAFRPRTQKYIFREITLGYSHRGSSYLKRTTRGIDELYDIVQANPAIPSSVRMMTLFLSDTIENEWVTSNAKFLSIMDAISKSPLSVQEICLSGGSGPLASPLPLASDFRTFTTCFWTPFIAPSLTSLELRGAKDVPTALFTSCPRLVYLELCGSTVERIAYSPLHSQDSFQRPYIKTLITEDSLEAIRVLAGLPNNAPGPIVDFTHLELLRASGTFYLCDISGIKRVLDLAGSSLRTLILSPDSSFGGLSSLFYDLGRLPALEWLAVSLYAEEDFLREYCELLDTIPNQNTIYCIDIHMEGADDEDEVANPELKDLAAADWARLDSTLIRIASGKPLQVALDVYYYMSHSVPEGGALQEQIEKRAENLLMTWTQEHLPLAMSAPHIAVKYEYALL